MFLKTTLFRNILWLAPNNVKHDIKRNIFPWLKPIFNQVDQDRRNLVGPDRACAEWLIRNGAAVKWRGEAKLFNNYDGLVGLKDDDRLCLEVIDATGSAISSHGFPNLQGCRYVSKIIFDDCGALDDKAIEQLDFVKLSLKFLQISNCPDVTHKGLLSCSKLLLLQELILANLPSVDKKQDTMAQLQHLLPRCKITFDAMDFQHKSE